MVPVEAAVVLVLQTDAATAHANGVGAAKLISVQQAGLCCLSERASFEWRPSQRTHCHFRASH